jgi:hypothetical protein
MVKILAISLVSLLVLGMSPGSADLLEGEDRGRGEMVVISGNDRPDLVDHFDFIKDNLVLLRGVVYVKDRDGNLVIPEEVEAETREILAKIEEEDRERERVIMSTSQAQVCLRCPGCGERGVFHKLVLCRVCDDWSRECLGCRNCNQNCSACGKEGPDCKLAFCQECKSLYNECQECDHEKSCLTCGKVGGNCPNTTCSECGTSYRECDECYGCSTCSNCGKPPGCLDVRCQVCGGTYIACNPCH